MIRLVALDLDGTFYAGRTLGVPDSAWQAIEKGKREGLKFAVCTGRPQGGFGLEWGRRIEPDGPHVFNDGASICTAEGRPLYIALLPNLRELVGLARKNGLNFDLNTATGGRYYEPELMPPGILEHVAMVGIAARSRPDRGGSRSSTQPRSPRSGCGTWSPTSGYGRACGLRSRPCLTST